MPALRAFPVVLATALCATALGAVTTALPAQAADAAPMAGPARCRFAVPAGWPTRDLRWSGACKAGLADGRGLLRLYEGGKVTRVFYGTLRAGQAQLGVVERDGGFEAGRFAAGRVVVDGDRNTLIQAFDAASAAARALAETYRKAGNAASARYYQAKAAQLAQQLD